MLYIKIENSISALNEIRMVNILGQTLFTGQAASGGTTAIDLTGISEGIYRLVIITDQGTVGENIVIAK